MNEPTLLSALVKEVLYLNYFNWSVANYPSGTYTVAIFSKAKNAATLLVAER